MTSATIEDRVREQVAAWPAQPDNQALYTVLRLLGRWRATTLARTYIEQQGAKVWCGPFAGMEYLSAATEGALVARLLGTYESELHPYLAHFAEQGLDCVIDVGCAEGYYAVGLARAMPGITVHAHDISEGARAACADLAARNGVSERVIIGGEFKPDGFEAFAGRRVLVLVDVEGAEVDLLQPELSPALAHMNLIVETHDLYRPGTYAALVERFSATHHIKRVDQQPKAFQPPPWFSQLAHLDQLLAVWEWRLRPTPWLVMQPKR
ncbi:MAG: SAM-dependent methyltransferase [Phenylobacterium sp.]|jgi:hypothetical protein|nr:SAM-dependent methyltransferase [Phenylobacterium sp.]